MNRRLLANLEERFQQGDYYEAHQICRTIYYRLIRERKYSQIYQLLYDGAIRLFDYGQQNSGADLALLLVDMLATKVDSPATVARTVPQIIDDMGRLFEKMAPNSPERIQFVTMVLKIAYLPAGAIRKQLAEVLWQREKNYPEARLHFVYSSDNGNNCAMMLVEYHTQHGYPFEMDLMIAQFVLQVLCLENHQLAHNTFYLYTTNHPMIRCNKPPFMTPLLNFLCFLFVAIDKFRGKNQVFTVLCDLYERSLNRDPCYKDYLRQIGQIYFGVEKKPASGGLFSNLSGLFSLFDFGENHNDESPSASSSHRHPYASNTIISNNENQQVDLD